MTKKLQLLEFAGYLLIIVSLICDLPKTSSSPLSENVTRVLNDLLKKPYDKRLRPLLGENALFVKVGFKLDSFLGIDEANSEASVRMTLKQSWLEPRLTFPAGVLPNDTIQLGPEQTKYLWIPDTVIGNQQNLQKIEGHESTFLNFDGSILISIKYSLTFDCEMDHYYFPFDTQTCSIIFMSYTHDRRDIIYDWMPEESTGSWRRSFQQGRFKLISSDTQTSNTFIGHKQGNSVLLVLRLHFQGIWDNFYFSVFLPVGFFTAISLGTLWLNFKTALVPILANFLNIASLNIYLIILIRSGTSNLQIRGTALGQYLTISLSFIVLSLLAHFIKSFLESNRSKLHEPPKVEDEDEDGLCSEEAEDIEKGIELGNATKINRPWSDAPRRRSAASQSSPARPEYGVYIDKAKQIMERFICQSHWILLAGFVVANSFYFGFYVNSLDTRVQDLIRLARS